MQNGMKEYSSRDFYISASLLAKGITLLRLERETATNFLFIFDITPEEAKKLIADHWNKNLMVPSRNLIEAINELKTRIHNGY
jgi:hypothetical protein